MSYDFPASPTSGQEFTPPGGGQTYVFVPPRWLVKGVPPAAVNGPPGPTGPAGPIGPTGPTGATGPAGPDGPVGPAGPKGDKGDAGAAGPQGVTGSQGPQGVKGDTGAAGTTGPQGTQGVKGDPGAPGDTGAQGPKGDTGATGPAGTTDWSGLTNKPATFPPDPHQHPFTAITGALTDAQHGLRGNAGLHSLATSAAPGFMIDAPNDSKPYARKALAWYDITADLAGKVNIAGDTMTGGLMVPTLTIGNAADGLSNGGGILLRMRITGFSETIQATNGASFRGMIGFDQYDQFIVRAGDNVNTDLTVSTAGNLIARGGVIGATLNSVPTAGSATLVLNKPASGQHNIMYGQTNGVMRWYLNLGNSTAESGGNAGSDFIIYRYDDDGTPISTALSITRSSGFVSIPGALTVAGSFVANAYSFSANGYFIGAASQVVLGTNTGGTTQQILLRPTAYNSAAGQVIITTAQTYFTTNVEVGNFTSVAPWTGGTLVYTTGAVYMSSAAASAQPERFYTTSGLAGYISNTNATTAYVTSSDASLKELKGEYDPQEAIAILRADPVLAFSWKDSGEEAVGWFAQKSFAVDPNLAVQPTLNEEELAAVAEGHAQAPGEPGYVPWGIDYGRRTPYLWAALTWALDQIDQLTARVAALEAPT